MGFADVSLGCADEVRIPSRNNRSCTETRAHAVQERNHQGGRRAPVGLPRLHLPSSGLRVGSTAVPGQVWARTKVWLEHEERQSREHRAFTSSSSEEGLKHHLNIIISLQDLAPC